MIYKRESEIIKSIFEEVNKIGPIYIYTTDFEEKWNPFLRKDIENCLARLPIKKFSDKKLNKYFKKRFLQCYQKAYKLLLNKDFIKRVLELAIEFNLDCFIFGLSPEAREHIKDIVNGNENINIFAPEGLPSGDRTPLEYYDLVIRTRLNHMLYLYLEVKDHYYINKYKDKFQNNILDPKNNKYARNMPSEKYNRDLKRLLKDFGLSFWWKDSITMLLLTGRFFTPENYCPIKIERENDEIIISIPIAPETQLEDIKFVWKKIEKVKKDLIGSRHERFSSKELSYLSLSKKMNTGEIDSLIDNVPESIDDKAIFERRRKGIQRAKKWILKTKSPNIRKVKSLSKGIIDLKLSNISFRI